MPDCSDPDAAVFTERVVASISAQVSGSGTLAMESSDEWRLWFLSGLEKNIRVKLDTTLANNGGYFAMSAVLTAFNISGNVGDLSQIEVTIDSNGEITWVPAVA